MAEGAGVELSAGGFDFFGWDVTALDGGVAPAFPVVAGVLLHVAPEVVEPAGGTFGCTNEESPALFVGEGGAEDLEPDARVHEGGFVEDDSA